MKRASTKGRAVTLTGMATGLLSFWLAPVAVSLALAPVLSRLSSLRVADHDFLPLRLDTPLSLRAPRVERRARDERARLRAVLEEGAPALPAMAAE